VPSGTNVSMRPTKSRSPFTRFAKSTSRYAGRPISFLVAVTVVLAWLAAGPVFGFSDTWQLVINTGTTIVTFLMVFLIQNTQFRDAEAVQIKLDELLRVTRGAHTALLDLEELEDHELDVLHRRYEQVAKEARERLRRGEVDTGSPEVKTD
jgi:low affinity Fe/Cu permease